jgi:hypothetical protein
MGVLLSLFHLRRLNRSSLELSGFGRQVATITAASRGPDLSGCIKLTNSENVLRTNESYVIYPQSDQGLRVTRTCDELYLDRVSTVDLDDDECAGVRRCGRGRCSTDGAIDRATAPAAGGSIVVVIADPSASRLSSRRTAAGRAASPDRRPRPRGRLASPRRGGRGCGARSRLACVAGFRR